MYVVHRNLKVTVEIDMPYKTELKYHTAQDARAVQKGLNKAVRTHILACVKLLKYLVVFSYLLPVATMAYDKSLCGSGQLSSAAEGSCLSEEYQGASKLLNEKVKRLLQLAATADTGFSDPVNVKARREAFVQAIHDSQRAWHKQVEVECSVLLEGSFGTGNGATNASMQCKISRVYERIAHLSKAEPYSWLWP